MDVCGRRALFKLILSFVFLSVFVALVNSTFAQYVPFAFIRSTASSGITPEDFYIKGITSTDGTTDLVEDNLLVTATTARVTWSAALDATSYDISLRNTNDTT